MSSWSAGIQFFTIFTMRVDVATTAPGRAGIQVSVIVIVIVRPIEVIVDTDVGVAKIFIVSSIVIQIVRRAADRVGHNISTVAGCWCSCCTLFIHRRCHKIGRSQLIFTRALCCDREGWLTTRSQSRRR